MKKEKIKGEDRLSVTETNLRKAAARLLPKGEIVSTEIQYILRTLGASATQQVIDENVMAVRKMPWSSISIPD